MNKWVRRAVGTVGIAGGMLLLGAGAAQADDATTQGSQPLHGLVEEFFDPTNNLGMGGGISGAGVSVDTPGQQTTAGSFAGRAPVQQTRNNGELGAALHAPDASGKPRAVFAGGKPPNVAPMIPTGLPVESAEADPARTLVGAPPQLPDGNSLGTPLDGNGLPPMDPFATGIPTTGALPTAGLPLVGESTRRPSPRPLPATEDAKAFPGTQFAFDDTASRWAETALDMVGSATTFEAPARDESLPVGVTPGQTPTVPLVDDLTAGRLPVRGNVNTLPNTPPIPLGEHTMNSAAERYVPRHALPESGPVQTGSLPMVDSMLRNSGAAKHRAKPSPNGPKVVRADSKPWNVPGPADLLR
ncbi:hypothetical protein Val02_85010 [Virgisporangium aliadipatigenens]|uniref:Uncharacterized protein n=1 Tax=Virgisporangium aliadipatigenens TaxID=741659 RepID=A0A8J3YXJ8_9ACTN|nr:hypothetical protein [Virgisporangium aliadipatigenens]GIJ51615.1 hypothetical protein Val02_85010 [Virgisporangium aliadipatigenens]